MRKDVSTEMTLPYFVHVEFLCAYLVIHMCVYVLDM